MLLAFGMRTLGLRIAAFCILCGMLSCSTKTDYAVNVTASMVEGTWVLRSAPSSLSNLLSGTTSSSLKLETAGSASFQALPINGSANGVRPTWKVVTGTGTWSLSAVGSKPVWKVDLLTGVQGVQLAVMEDHENVSLMYKPDPDTEEKVVFTKNPQSPR